MEVDVCTASLVCEAFARVCAEVDLTKPLKSGFLPKSFPEEWASTVLDVGWWVIVLMTVNKWRRRCQDPKWPRLRRSGLGRWQRSIKVTRVQKHLWFKRLLESFMVHDCRWHWESEGGLNAVHHQARVNSSSVML